MAISGGCGEKVVYSLASFHVCDKDPFKGLLHVVKQKFLCNIIFIKNSLKDFRWNYWLFHLHNMVLKTTSNWHHAGYFARREFVFFTIISDLNGWQRHPNGMTLNEIDSGTPRKLIYLRGVGLFGSYWRGGRFAFLQYPSIVTLYLGGFT